MATASARRYNKPECDNCREAGVLKDAVLFCSECDLHFCVACDKLHGKFAPGHKTDIKKSDDIAGDMVDERTMYATCSKHRKETAEYYCQAHESVICKACKLPEHASCALQIISDACEEINMSKGVRDITEQLIELQEATDKLTREKQMTLDTYQSDIDEHRHNIKSLRRKFNNMFDRYDSQLESLEAASVNNLSSSIRSCVRLSDQVKGQTKSLEDIQDGVNKQMLFKLLVNARKARKDLRSVFDEIRSKKVGCDMKLKEDKNHGTLLEQLSMLVHQEADSGKVVDSECAEVDTNDKIGKKSFFNIKSCSFVKETDARVLSDKSKPMITGCCWLPDGQVILCDCNNDNIKILDTNFNIKFTAPCPSHPWDVDCIDNSTVVVTLPSAKSLQIISVKPGFKVQQKKNLDLRCVGVCVHDKNIFVCIEESEPSKNGVKVLNLNGDDVSFILHSGSGTPRNVCVTADGTKICYIGGSGNDHFMNCVTKDGYGIFSVSSSELSHPRGIVRDESNNIIICDDSKICVQIISAEGVCGNILLTEKNSMYAPKSMCLNKTYDNLIIASYKDVSSGTPISKLTVYKLEYS